MTCKEKILSEEYGEIVLDFTVQNPPSSYCFKMVNEEFGIAYVPLSELNERVGSLYAYQYLPKVFGLMQETFDPVSLMSSGIIQVQRPPLGLRGRGVVIAFVDTGIRFTEAAFRNEAGNSRILAIWDQTVQTGEPPEGYEYGTEFTREDINRALRTDEPYDAVPSFDEIGHGTAMASVAAGSAIDGGRTFLGAAPEADIVVVKLRQAKQYLREYNFIPEGIPAYAESDIMLGIKYVESFAVTFNRPVVICIGMGSNRGNHTLGSFLAQYLNSLAGFRNRGIVICGGNEGNAAHHFSGSVPRGDVDAYTDVEIRVGEGESGFLMEMWGSIPEVFYVSVRTPGGETIPRFRLGMGQRLTYSFIYERTKVTINSILVEPNSGDELIVFRFDAPTAGIWTIRVYSSQAGGTGEFHMWLPISQFLSSNTFFLRPDPYVTLTDPGIAWRPLTTSTYNDRDNSIYVNSGRGFLKNGLIKPDLAAPGVDVQAINGRVTGSSIGAALTAGGMAQFFQWAVVEQNNPLAESQEIKSYFIRGAARSPGVLYPNREWGYGRLDVAGTFDALAGV